MIGLLTTVSAVSGCGSKGSGTPAESPSTNSETANGSPFAQWKSDDTGIVIDLSNILQGQTGAMKVWSSEPKLICECNVLVTGPEGNGFASVSACTTKVSSADSICKGLENNYSYSIKEEELTACILGTNSCFIYTHTKLTIPSNTTCIFDSQSGTYKDFIGQACFPKATQITCPANGIYTNQYGQQQYCTPGQVVNTPESYSYPGQYQYPNYMNQTGCDQYYYQYGVQYVPVVMNGQLQCVRYDLVNQYSYGTPYYNNIDYYYAYPPYQQNYGNQSCFFTGFGGLNGGYCGTF